MAHHGNPETPERGGFIALAALAALVGAGAAILFAPAEGAKPRRQSRREQQLAGLAGLVVGAGLATALMTESGSATRKKLGGALGRIKVGAVDRIDRLRQRSRDSREGAPPAEQPVPTVQELGRDPDSVF
jgi:hypothetical protein